MKICVVILDYKGMKKTIRCLHSLIGQGISTVCLVDNATYLHESTILAEAESALPGKDYEIKLLKPSANLGFAAGVNYAIKYLLSGCTVYDYLILINNDASAPPGMVNKLYQPHLASNSGLLIAPSIKFNGHILPGTWYHRFTGLTLHKQVPGSFQYLSGCCLLIPNSEVRENLFDEDFFMYGEDVQLSWMLQKAGKNTLLLDETYIAHEGSGSSRIGQLFYEYHMARGHMLLAFKLANSYWEVPILIIGRMLVMPIRALVRTFRYRSLAPIVALCLAFFDLNIRPDQRDR